MASCQHPNAMLSNTIEIISLFLTSTPREIFLEKPAFYKSLRYYKQQCEFVKTLNVSNVGLMFQKQHYLDTTQREQNLINSTDFSDALALTEYKMMKNLDYNKALANTFSKYLDDETYQKLNMGGGLKEKLEGFVTYVLGAMILCIIGTATAGKWAHGKIKGLMKQSSKEFLLSLVEDQDMTPTQHFILQTMLLGIHPENRRSFFAITLKMHYKRAISQSKLPRFSGTSVQILYSILAYLANYIKSSPSKIEKATEQAFKMFFGTASERMRISMIVKSEMDKETKKQCNIQTQPTLTLQDYDRFLNTVLFHMTELELDQAIKPTSSYAFVKQVLDNAHKVVKQLVPNPVQELLSAPARQPSQTINTVKPSVQQVTNTQPSSRNVTEQVIKRSPPPPSIQQVAPNSNTQTKMNALPVQQVAQTRSNTPQEPTKNANVQQARTRQAPLNTTI